MIRRALIALATLLFVTTPASAYWDYGHETVAEIAWLSVTPATRVEIARLLRESDRLETEGCPARTVAEASVWPDCIKRYGPRFSYASSWHYQNVAVCRPFTLEGNCPDGNCVSAQISRNARLLADRTLPARERLMALAFLIHFVGDLHQPLHAGDDDDRGGNDAPASYGLYTRDRLNLHSVWDGYLAERAISSPRPGARGLIAEAGGDRDMIAAGTVEDWSRENWAVARDAVYAPVRGGDPCARGGRARLTDERIAAAVPVLRRQVARGGLRLARLLDDALAPAAAAAGGTGTRR